LPNRRGRKNLELSDCESRIFDAGSVPSGLAAFWGSDHDVLSRRYRSCSRLLSALTFVVALTTIITAGCGSGGGPSGPKLSGNTEVTVLVSATANDQLQLVQAGFTNLTLTSQSGKTVNLLSTQAA